MAIYHASLKSFSRGKGDSATAAAAYRAGLRIEDPRTGKVSDYTRRGGVVGWEMLAPKDAPDWCRDPARFFAESEKAESRANARVGRELEVSLPHELTADQRRELAHTIGQDMVNRWGVAALVAIHEPHGGQGDERNHHVHILLSARQVAADGLGQRAMAAFDERQGAGQDAVRALRERVAYLVNGALHDATLTARVSHLSLKEQARAHLLRGDYDMAAAVTRAPTVHEGKATTAARRQGHVLERARWNDATRLDNRTALDDYLKKAGREGRLMAEQQTRDDKTGAAVPPRRTLGKAAGRAGPVRHTQATVGPAVHVERAAATKAATAPDGVKKSKEQKAEEARTAGAQALMQKWLAAATRLSEIYLEDVRKAGMDDRRVGQVASQIYEKIQAMAEARARKDAGAEFRAQSAEWRQQRRHMRQVVHYGDEQRRLDARRQAHRKGVKKWGEAQAVLHERTVDERMTEWGHAHPEPGRLLHREQWLEWDKKRRAYLHVLENAEADRVKAEKAIMGDAQQRDAALDEQIIAERQAALEAKRRERWPVAADQEPQPKVPRFPQRQQGGAKPIPAATLAQAVKPRAVPPSPVPPLPPVPRRPRPPGT